MDTLWAQANHGLPATWISAVMHVSVPECVPLTVAAPCWHTKHTLYRETTPDRTQDQGGVGYTRCRLPGTLYRSAVRVGCVLQPAGRITSDGGLISFSGCLSPVPHSLGTSCIYNGPTRTIRAEKGERGCGTAKKGHVSVPS